MQQIETQFDSLYTTKNGIIFFKGRVVIPKKLRETLLYETHDTKMGGHSGMFRTYKHLVQQFYWSLMFQLVQDYINRCTTCHKTKSETLQPAGLLQPLLIPCQVWEDISLDFVEGLPNSLGRDAIFVVVDRLSKYAHFISLSHPFTAKPVAKKIC